MIRICIYHSHEWESLVETGWVTMIVDWLEPRHIQVATMYHV